MKRKNRDVEEEVEQFEYPRYSDAGLADIDRRLRLKFFRAVTLGDGRTIVAFDEDAYMRAVGAKSGSGAILVEPIGESDGRTLYASPNRFQLAQHMLGAWRAWTERQEERRRAATSAAVPDVIPGW